MQIHIHIKTKGVVIVLGITISWALILTGLALLTE